jgi:multimeric flavodoxin WrbA
MADGGADTKKMLIVWFSRTGGAEAMARAAARAAEEQGETAIVIKRAEQAEAEDVLAANGYLFVCPENLAAIAGEMKEFFDRVYYDVLGRIEGRPYAAMICAGSDGENALRQVERIAKGWRLKKIADSLIICTHAQTREQILAPKRIGEKELEKCCEIGATLSAGLAMGVF